MTLMQLTRLYPDYVTKLPYLVVGTNAATHAESPLMTNQVIHPKNPVIHPKRRNTSLTAELTNETCWHAESAVWVSAASFTVVDTDDGVSHKTTGGTNQAQCFCLMKSL